MIGKRVAPPTSCSWQRVTDGTKCYIEPRTCYDCLNTKLANGDECTLTPFGLCTSMSEYDYTQDYRRGGPAGAFPIHYNYFPETNATYCEANDALCNLCKSSRFSLDDNNPSTYCEGNNNCVCVKICESDSWRNETLERLRIAMVERNETVNATCSIAANSSSGASSSASGSDDVSSVNIFTTHIRKNVYANEDTCRWYQNQTFCDVPRSCYECLNVPLYSGQKCMINPAGYCASMSEYDYTHDYHVHKSAGAAHYFPSTNTTYCEANDAVCQKCKETTFTESITGATNPTQYCVGANGCVCVAFCESANWKAIVKDATCSVSVVVSSSNGQFSVATIALMMIGFTLAFTGAIQLLTIVRTRREYSDSIKLLPLMDTSNTPFFLGVSL
uniref:Uncharacterized protein n=1 Tax=Globisporangium ultimum (strain ATCC 200006 / CBS 805.95 / DAOM BR144) TaxID=431595 RepID=K3X0Q6_GLOUD